MTPPKTYRPDTYATCLSRMTRRVRSREKPGSNTTDGGSCPSPLPPPPPLPPPTRPSGLMITLPSECIGAVDGLATSTDDRTPEAPVPVRPAPWVPGRAEWTALVPLP